MAEINVDATGHVTYADEYGVGLIRNKDAVANEVATYARTYGYEVDWSSWRETPVFSPMLGNEDEQVAVAFTVVMQRIG